MTTARSAADGVPPSGSSMLLTKPKNLKNLPARLTSLCTFTFQQLNSCIQQHGFITLERDVGLYARFMYRAAIGFELVRRGDLYRLFVVQRQHRLHRTFAITARADDFGTAVVLQCAGDNLCGRSRTLVDQYD